MELALNEPENGPAFDGTSSPINIIAANIFEYIESKLWDYFREHEEDYLDNEDEEESEEDI